MRTPTALASLFAASATAAAQTSAERDYTGSDWWIVYLTALLSVFTLGLMLYTARLWRATVKLSADAEANASKQHAETARALGASERAAAAAEKSAEVAASTLSVAQRAFVFWKGFNCGPHLWDNRIKEYVVFADAENVGLTPALEVRITIRTQITRGTGAQLPTFTPEAGEGSSTALGPKSSVRTGFVPIPIGDLVECWEHRCDIYVWCHIQYRDVFAPSVLHHHQNCAKLHLIHDPTTAPPEGHPPYIQFMTSGPQNDAS